MGEQTTLTKATSKSGSLRTTVPKGIVKHFEMAERDRLEWNMRVKNSKLTIEVSHIRTDGNKASGSVNRRERKLAKKPDDGGRTEQEKAKSRWRLR